MCTWAETFLGPVFHEQTGKNACLVDNLQQ